MTADKLLGKLIITTFALLVVTACTSGGGDNNNGGGGSNTQGDVPTPTPEPTATPDPTATPQPTPTPPPSGTPGEFISTGTISEAQANGYFQTSKGCMTNGKPESRKQIDKRLKVGDRFRDTMFFADPDIEYTLSLDSTVQAITARTSDHLAKVLATTFPGVKVGQMSRSSCEVISDTEGECQGETSIEIQGVAFYVFLPNIFTESVKTYETGYYVLDNGFGVPAWRFTDDATGLVADPQGLKIVGAGTQKTTSIYLNDIPSSGLDFCGGVQGMNETLVMLDSGQRVNRIGGTLDGVNLK
ncbi:MAG: hypothetical protein ABL958_17540 [Bdellovibrionia bacterium]